MIETSDAGADRCLVIHPQLLMDAGSFARSAKSQLEEAVGLAEAIHLEVAHAQIFQLKRHTPKTHIGSGQVDQCAQIISEQHISLVIVNTQLSPTQQRNLEKAWSCKVIDRTALILEIFGERAQTAEGRLQVELAALNYQKSRLVRSWTHLERQRGGAGFMGGPGEKQIETDRRLIAERIIAIKKQLAKVVRTRELHRKTRRDAPYPVVALVGYTNAGKSTLFNRLGGADVLAADMLFATLDPTIRAITLPQGQQIMLSDTVGFISDLPHELIAAFRATLEEVLEADVLVHVRDVSNPDTEAQKADVESVLKELCGTQWEDKRRIEAWNKIDCVEDPERLPKPAGDYVILSALTGDGVSSLLHRIETLLQAAMFVEREYRIAHGDGKALAWLHAHGNVRSRTDGDDAAIVVVSISPANAARYEKLFLFRDA